MVLVGDGMKQKHLGTRFDDFLADEGVLDECRASAIRFKIARELEKAMSERKLSKADIARQLKTSRTGVDRLLDLGNTSITLNTMAKVARLRGKRIEFAMR
jgi:antitoxin HicB